MSLRLGCGVYFVGGVKGQGSEGWEGWGGGRLGLCACVLSLLFGLNLIGLSFQWWRGCVESEACHDAKTWKYYNNLLCLYQVVRNMLRCLLDN